MLLIAITVYLCCLFLSLCCLLHLLMSVSVQHSIASTVIACALVLTDVNIHSEICLRERDAAVVGVLLLGDLQVSAQSHQLQFLAGHLSGEAAVLNHHLLQALLQELASHMPLMLRGRVSVCAAQLVLVMIGWLKWRTITAASHIAHVSITYTITITIIVTHSITITIVITIVITITITITITIISIIIINVGACWCPL